MKKILLSVFVLAVSASFASAFTVDTGEGTSNALITDGVAYAIPINKICGMKSWKAGPARYDVGRVGKYVTIGDLPTRIVCSNKIGGGGSSFAPNF